MDGYVVWDLQKSLPANRTLYASRKRAARQAEKLNLQYGAHRYYVKSTRG